VCPEGPRVLPVLETLKVGIGLFLGHVTPFHCSIQLCSGVPDADVPNCVLERTRFDGRTQLRSLCLGDTSRPNHPIESFHKSLASPRYRLVVRVFIHDPRRYQYIVSMSMHYVLNPIFSDLARGGDSRHARAATPSAHGSMVCFGERLHTAVNAIRASGINPELRQQPPLGCSFAITWLGGDRDHRLSWTQTSENDLDQSANSGLGGETASSGEGVEAVAG
jgi:hypothetical protein